MDYLSLKKTSEFSQVYKKGRSFANRYLVIYVFPKKNGPTRLGLSISKKVGNSVKRNQVRRLIKEVYRLSIALDQSYDLIIIARVKASELDFHAMEKNMIHLFKKAKLMV